MKEKLSKIVYRDDSGEYSIADFLQVACIVIVFLLAIGIAGAIGIH